jgi:hypothetical protein
MNSALPYIAKEEEKKKKRKKRKITTTSHRVRINGQTPRRSEEDHNKPSYKKTVRPQKKRRIPQQALVQIHHQNLEEEEEKEKREGGKCKPSQQYSVNKQSEPRKEAKSYHSRPYKRDTVRSQKKRVSFPFPCCPHWPVPPLL